MKTRGCVTEREYIDIKSRLERQTDLSLYETIDSTVENMVQDDKREVLGLLRSMKKDEEAKRMVALVKDYFEKVAFKCLVSVPSCLKRSCLGR